MNNRREEIEAILEEILPRLEALREDSMREIGEVREVASADVARHGEASKELSAVEERIAVLQAARKALPAEVTRANLDEEFEREDELRERYRNIKSEVEALEERRAGLQEELRRLNPEGWGHPSDATIHAYGRVAGVAHDARAELEGLRYGLTAALDGMLDPVARAHESTRATVWQLGHDRSHALSPVGQGGIRT